MSLFKEDIVASSTFELPARGSFPTVELAKKAPKQADALLIATFVGEEGLEVPGTSLLGSSAVSYTHLRAHET